MFNQAERGTTPSPFLLRTLFHFRELTDELD